MNHWKRFEKLGRSGVSDGWCLRHHPECGVWRVVFYVQVKTIMEEICQRLKNNCASGRKHWQLWSRSLLKNWRDAKESYAVSVLRKKVPSFTEILKGWKDVSAEMRSGAIGKHVNEARDVLTAVLKKHKLWRKRKKVQAKLASARKRIKTAVPSCHGVVDC